MGMCLGRLEGTKSTFPRQNVTRESTRTIIPTLTSNSSLILIGIVNEKSYWPQKSEQDSGQDKKSPPLRERKSTSSANLRDRYGGVGTLFRI